MPSMSATAHRYARGAVLRLYLAAGLWAASTLLAYAAALPLWLDATLALLSGMLLVHAATELVLIAIERSASALNWSRFTSASLVEALSSLPEIVVLAFLASVSPQAAFTLALLTIYKHALVYSLYSWFLPRNEHGEYLMPRPIAEAGTQVMIAAGALGLIAGVVILAVHATGHAKTGFEAIELALIAAVLLAVFIAYLKRLTSEYARDGLEPPLRTLGTLAEHPRPVRWWSIAVLIVLGIGGSFLGGEAAMRFAKLAMGGLALSELTTVLLMVGFAGVGEYVLIWKTHRRGEYGVSLAHVFGGIVKVIYLVLPITLLLIATLIASGRAPAGALPYSLGNMLLLIFLFPVFYVFSNLLEQRHTLSALDATIMSGIVVLLVMLLLSYA